MIFETQSNRGADPFGIRSGPSKPNPQSGPTSDVVKELRRTGVLANDQVGASVFVKVAGCSASLLPMDGDATC